MTKTTVEAKLGDSASVDSKLGDFASLKYSGRDNSGNPKSDYVNRIAALGDEGLLKEAKTKIWLSAFAASNTRSDYHWHVDAIYDECDRRGAIDTIYTVAHNYNLEAAR
jgi:hypothetical protein